MDMTPLQLIFSLILGLIIGGWTSYLAKLRGRDSRVWFLAGFFFGLLGLIVLLFLPDLTAKKEEDELPAPETVEPEIIFEDSENKLWYYLDNSGDQKGPIHLSELKDLFNEGNISSITYVWSEGMEEWKTIEECRVFTS
jgi:hypothetical protein